MVGRLARIKNYNTIFVIWKFDESSKIAKLSELDRPSDGRHLELHIDDIHLLTPREIFENVTEMEE